MVKDVLDQPAQYVGYLSWHTVAKGPVIVPFVVVSCKNWSLSRELEAGAVVGAVAGADAADGVDADVTVVATALSSYLLVLIFQTRVVSPSTDRDSRRPLDTARLPLQGL